METTALAIGIDFRGQRVAAVVGCEPESNVDLAQMEDMELILQAQTENSGTARDELILRYGTQRDRLIGWLASSTELRGVEVEDARQNGVFWTLEAIEKYNLAELRKERGCSFSTFLNRVVACRFKDYLKHVRRRNRRYERSVCVTAQTDYPVRTSRRYGDPADLAEAAEVTAGLYAALAKLDGESYRIWELLGEGTSLRQISAELGISYDAVKRRRRKLIQHLKVQLTASN